MLSEREILETERGDLRPTEPACEGNEEEGGVAAMEGQRCETPTAFANFPGEPLYKAPPRSWADRAYNITRWTDMASGGQPAASGPRSPEPETVAGRLRFAGLRTILSAAVRAAGNGDDVARAMGTSTR
mgnify:CR=1 FL=1